MSQQKLLIIGYVWPEPKSSAAGERMMQIILHFLAEGMDITFATTATTTPFMADLPSLGISIEKIRLNHSSFDEFLLQLCPDMVVFDRFMMEEQFGWRVAEICPKAIRILDTEDLHFLRKARQETVKDPENIKFSLLNSELAKREIASIYRCDISLIISKVELEILQETFAVPSFLLFYLPFMLNPVSEDEISDIPGFEIRKDFISIGNFLHDPNKDAVIRLKKEIWPIIRKKLPDARINIFGAYVPQEILELNNDKAGFIVRGRAISAEAEIRKSRVLLAPLRFGAGLKGKFIDAMQSGTPTVTTILGAEGMSEESQWNGILEDDPMKFADAAVQLYTNKKLWLNAQEKGFWILRNNFSRQVHSKRLKEKIEDISNNLEIHRSRNFTGRMLHQHSMSSTKYLAKYIEAKNKNRLQ